MKYRVEFTEILRGKLWSYWQGVGIVWTAYYTSISNNNNTQFLLHSNTKPNSFNTQIKIHGEWWVNHQTEMWVNVNVNVLAVNTCMSVSYWRHGGTRYHCLSASKTRRTSENTCTHTQTHIHRHRHTNTHTDRQTHVTHTDRQTH